MSSGSLAEVETQLLLSQRFGYLPESELSKLLSPLHGLARQLQALKNALSSRLAIDRTLPVPHSPFPAS